MVSKSIEQQLDEAYIKMCDCEEIQSLRQWKYYDNEKFRTNREGNFIEGDVIWADDKIYILGHTVYPPHEYSKYGLDIPMVGYDEGDTSGIITKLIWLPRQDQLQEMTGLDDINALLDRFYIAWIEWMRIDSEFIGYDNSMEQLWLAFVMKVKYNKVWDGDKWIEQK